MDPQECHEQLRLLDRYSRAITEYHVCLESVRHAHPDARATRLKALETSRDISEAAWKELEGHIAAHGCVGSPGVTAQSASRIADDALLGQAAAAALDIILVADDQRRLVAINQAAADALGLPRREIHGRLIEEFFVIASGEPLTHAWANFMMDGTQSGVCVLKRGGAARRFEYRARANFQPGLHLSVLRGIQAD